MLRSDRFIRFELGGGVMLWCTQDRKENTEGFILIQSYCSHRKNTEIKSVLISIVHFQTVKYTLKIMPNSQTACVHKTGLVLQVQIQKYYVHSLLLFQFPNISKYPTRQSAWSSISSVANEQEVILALILTHEVPNSILLL